MSLKDINALPKEEAFHTDPVSFGGSSFSVTALNRTTSRRSGHSIRQFSALQCGLLNRGSAPITVSARFSIVQQLANIDGATVYLSSVNPSFTSIAGFKEGCISAPSQTLMLQATHFVVADIELVVDQKVSVTIPPPQSLLDSIAHLRSDQGSSDMMFTVRDERFPAHKFIVSLRSSVFKAALETAIAESDTNIIVIGDCSPRCFEALLHFVYTDKLSAELLEKTSVEELLCLAHRYEVVGLVYECEAVMVHTMSDTRALDRLLFAETYSLERLGAASLTSVAAHFKALYASQPERFKALPNHLLVDIMSAVASL